MVYTLSNTILYRYIFLKYTLTNF